MTAIKPLSLMEHFRSRREMYLPESGSIPLFLAQRLSGDAIMIGASSVCVGHDGDWWTVAADRDWLADKKHTVDELFSRLICFSEAGANSMRSEVLLTAYAQDVVTIDAAGDRTIIKGSDASPAFAANVSMSRSWARIIRFRV